MAGEFSYVEAGSVFEHEVGGSGEFVGEDCVAFEFAVLLFKALGEGVECVVVAFSKYGGFAEGPA